MRGGGFLPPHGIQRWLVSEIRAHGATAIHAEIMMHAGKDVLVECCAPLADLQDLKERAAALRVGGPPV